MAFKLPCGFATVYMQRWTQKKVGKVALTVWLMTLQSTLNGCKYQRHLWITSLCETSIRNEWRRLTDAFRGKFGHTSDSHRSFVCI